MNFTACCGIELQAARSIILSINCYILNSNATAGNYHVLIRIISSPCYIISDRDCKLPSAINGNIVSNIQCAFQSDIRTKGNDTAFLRYSSSQFLFGINNAICFPILKIDFSITNRNIVRYRRTRYSLFTIRRNDSGHDTSRDHASEQDSEKFFLHKMTSQSYIKLPNEKEREKARAVKKLHARQFLLIILP